MRILDFKYRFITVMLIALVLTSCSQRGTAPVVEEKIVSKDDRPGWMRSRPMGNGFYTGIAGAQKINGLDFSMAARKKALEELVSEIEVTVSSESMLYKIDRDYSFIEEYTSNVKTTTTKTIEDYEIVDVWENSEEYWVYLRLNRSDYLNNKRRKKQEAQSLAYDHYVKGQTYESAGDAAMALNQYFNAMSSLKSYMAELNEVEHHGKSIYLGNEIYASVQRVLSSLEFRVEGTMDYVAGLGSFLSSSVELFNPSSLSSDDVAVSNVPLRFDFEIGSGEITTSHKTNTRGVMAFQLSNVAYDKPQQLLVVRVNLQKLIVDEDLKLLSSSFHSPRGEIKLNVLRPKLYLDVMGGSKVTSGFDHKVENSFRVGMFEVVSTKHEADLLGKMEVSIEVGGQSNGIAACYALSNITLIDRASGATVLHKELPRKKGVHLNYEGARQKALDNLLSYTRTDLMEEITNELQ